MMSTMNDTSIFKSTCWKEMIETSTPTKVAEVFSIINSQEGRWMYCGRQACWWQAKPTKPDPDPDQENVVWKPWHQSKAGMLATMRVLLNGDMNNLLMLYKSELLNKRQYLTLKMEVDAENGEEINEEKAKAQFNSLNVEIIQTDKLKDRLEDPSYCQKVILALAAILMKDDVGDILDQDPDILAFNNAVVYLEEVVDPSGGVLGNLGHPSLILPCGGKVFLKDRIHERDYIATTCGYDFPTTQSEINALKPLYNEVKALVKGLMPTDEDGEYLLNLLAVSMSGRNHLEQSVFFTGNGANGKTVLCDLYASAIGDYFDMLNVGYLTQKRQASNSAAPELACLRNKRAAFSTESDSTDCVFNSSKIKEFSDRIKPRELYKSPISFKPTFTLFVMTNVLPSFTVMDHGMARRLHALEFPKTYVFGEPKEGEYKADPSLKDKAKNGYYRVALMLVLLDQYVLKCSGNRDFPRGPSSKLFTDELVSDNDTVLSFVTNYVEILPLKTYPQYTTTQILSVYKSKTGDKNMEAPQLGRQLKRCGLKRDTKGFFLKFKTPESDTLAAEAAGGVSLLSGI